MAFAEQAVLVAVLLMMIWPIGTLTDIGFAPGRMTQGLVVGSLAGFAWLGLYAALIGIFRLKRSGFWRLQQVVRSAAYWLAISVSSAFVEELWRVVCLSALATRGSVEAVLVTAAAFGLAHAEPVGRLIGAALFGVFAGWLYFTVGNAWSLVVAHVTVNIGVRFVIRLASA